MKYVLLTAMIAFAPLAARAQDVEQLPAARVDAIDIQSRDAAWYTDHPAERQATLDQCEKSSHGDTDPGCISARLAQKQADGALNPPAQQTPD